jgi:hypothetical protein
MWGRLEVPMEAVLRVANESNRGLSKQGAKLLFVFI